MKPLMALHNTIPLFDIHPKDSSYVKKLKSEPFSSEIRVGKDCVTEMVRDMISHSKEVKKRTNLIRNEYAKIKLTDTEQRMFDAVKTCDLCHCLLDKETRKIKDHSHFMPIWNRAKSQDHIPLCCDDVPQGLQHPNNETGPYDTNDQLRGRVLCNYCNLQQNMTRINLG